MIVSRHGKASRGSAPGGDTAELRPIRLELCTSRSTRHQEQCACAGPPVFATYEAQGARFAVTLEPKLASRSTAGFLRVRAPSNVVVLMPETTGYLIPEGKDPIPFKLMRVEPVEERGTREVLKRQGILEHRFEFAGAPPIAFAGTLQLPTLYLDGIAVSAPLLKFARRPYAGTIPLNC